LAPALRSTGSAAFAPVDASAVGSFALFAGIINPYLGLHDWQKNNSNTTFIAKSFAKAKFVVANLATLKSIIS
jgi:hypothetical protein